MGRKKAYFKFFEYLNILKHILPPPIHKNLSAPLGRVVCKLQAGALLLFMLSTTGGVELAICWSRLLALMCWSINWRAVESPCNIPRSSRTWSLFCGSIVTTIKLSLYQLLNCWMSLSGTRRNRGAATARFWCTSSNAFLCLEGILFYVLYLQF